MVGTVNGIFAVSMILLAFKFWNRVNIALKIVLMVAISLFIIIQPIMVYLGARRQIKAVPMNMKIVVSDEGIYILTPKEKSRIRWKEVKGVRKKLDIVILYMGEGHGFILSNRILEGKIEEFYAYVISGIKKYG